MLNTVKFSFFFKSVLFDPHPISTSGQTFHEPNELLQFVQKDPADHKYHCVLCNKFSHKTSYCARNHVEAQHFPNMFVYPCEQCDITFSTKNSLTTHISRKHKYNNWTLNLFPLQAVHSKTPVNCSSLWERIQLIKSSTALCVVDFPTVSSPVQGTMWSQNIILIVLAIPVTCVLRYLTQECSLTITNKPSIRKSECKIDIFSQPIMKN